MFNKEYQKLAFENLLKIIDPSTNKTYESVQKNFINWYDNEWSDIYENIIDKHGPYYDYDDDMDFLEKYIIERLLAKSIVNMNNGKNKKLRNIFKSGPKGYLEWYNNFPEIALYTINFLAKKDHSIIIDNTINDILLIDYSQTIFLGVVLVDMYNQINDKYKLEYLYVGFPHHQNHYFDDNTLKKFLEQIDKKFNILLEETKIHIMKEEKLRKERRIFSKKHKEIIERCCKSNCSEFEYNKGGGIFCKIYNRSLTIEDECPKESKNIAIKQQDKKPETIETNLPKDVMDAIERYATIISYEGNDYNIAVSQRIDAHNKLCELLSIDKEEFKPFEYDASVISGNMKYKTALNILISSIKHLKNNI